MVCNCRDIFYVGVPDAQVSSDDRLRFYCKSF